MGYDLARQFGLEMRPPRPALVPLVLGAKARAEYCDLAGVSAEVVVSTGRQSFREKMLITHRGLSGPAILQISSYWDGKLPIRIDLAPDREICAELRHAKARNIAAARSSLQSILPKRLAARWIDLHAPQTWTNQDLDQLEREAHEWMIEPAGTEGYEKAEVTAGGVDTDDLSSKTMEAERSPGIIFYRRSGRRHRPFGRLQLSMGLGLRAPPRGRLNSCVIQWKDAAMSRLSPLILHRSEYDVICAVSRYHRISDMANNRRYDPSVLSIVWLNSGTLGPEHRNLAWREGETMNSRKFWRKPQAVVVAMLLFAGVAGIGMARAKQNLFAPGLHAALKLADPAEGPSRTGFAPVVKEVLPDVVNISTSKVVKASDQSSDDQDGIPPLFQQFFGQQFPGNESGKRDSKNPRINAKTAWDPA